MPIYDLADILSETRDAPFGGDSSPKQVGSVGEELFSPPPVSFNLPIAGTGAGDVPARKQQAPVPATFVPNMDAKAVSVWDNLAKSFPSLKVNSAARSEARNLAVGGARDSRHLYGQAYDVDTSGMDNKTREALIQEARKSGFTGVGVYDNSLHFDVGPKRAWGADYSNSSIPDWARPFLG